VPAIHAERQANAEDRAGEPCSALGLLVPDIRDVFRRDVVEKGLPKHPGQPPHDEQGLSRAELEARLTW
jgi:hypothetical protein